MRLLLRWTGRLLLAVCALGVAEFIGVSIAFSGGILLVPLSPFLVIGGVLAGGAALVVGAIRARRGAPAGGIGGFDVLVHALLLANTVLLAVLFLLPRALGAQQADWALLAALATASTALVGIPFSVGLSWSRAFAAPEGEPVQLHRWVLRVAHAANLVLAAAVLWSWGGGGIARLLGSMPT